MIKVLKENPFAAASALISAIAAILGAFWAIDSHYASAADLENMQRSFSQQINQNRADDLDDKVFQLQLKKNKQNGKLDPDDAAMLERYERKLQQAQGQLKEIK